MIPVLVPSAVPGGPGLPVSLASCPHFAIREELGALEKESFGLELARRQFLGSAIATTAAAGLIRVSRAAPALAAFPVRHSPAEWRQALGAARYAILREGATERPFTSALLEVHRRGIFFCAGCANPLFSSSTKFDSGTGWPSFYSALPRAVVTRPDYRLVVERTEVLCTRCAGHLGHVFADGPRPTGLRYCINGLALTFRAS